MPNYLSFVKGVVDSDDLPLNVSRETLQQHKLLKVIKKKLVRKTLDMIKKISDEKYGEFWKEYSTNIKLGVIEDTANRTRLAKLLRFTSSNGKLSSLAEYVERMKDKQENIFYIAGGSVEEVKSSPFVERLLKSMPSLLFLSLKERNSRMLPKKGSILMVTLKLLMPEGKRFKRNSKLLLNGLVTTLLRTIS